MGTPGYGARLSARRSDLDARTDVFALGCIGTFRYLTGKPSPRAFVGEHVIALRQDPPRRGAAR
jgi:serine/threonine protein kinase